MSLDPAKIKEALAFRPADPMAESSWVEAPSPDGKFVVVHSHGCELTMMNWRYWPTLLSGAGDVVSLLQPAQAVDISCAWAKGAPRFALHVSVGPEGFLIVDAEKREWCAVGARRGARAHFEAPDRLRVSLDAGQLSAINAVAPDVEVPVRRFKARPPEHVRLKDWRPLAALEHLDDAFEERFAETDPLPDGWHPFKRKPPQSTTQRFNGRPFELHHLYDFAEWGDPQSKAWLDEVMRLSEGRTLNKWDKVQKHLGKRVRAA